MRYKNIRTDYEQYIFASEFGMLSVIILKMSSLKKIEKKNTHTHTTFYHLPNFMTLFIKGSRRVKVYLRFMEHCVG